jgi:cell division protein FtsI/penicillin-binding protein 2
MQESVFDDAIANNGQLMRPTVVMKIADPSGTVVQPFNAQSLGNLISQTTASQVRDAMYGVVRCGTGSIIPKLFYSPWAIMAKTGTGQLGGNKPPEAWLLTQAPYPNPVLTIVAMKENGGEGGFVDGPMVGDMYDYIFANVIHIPAPPPPETQQQYCFNETHLLQG